MPTISEILQNLPLRKPIDKVISSSRAGTELRAVIQKFRPFVDDVQAAIADLDDRVTDATSTTVNLDLAALNLPPDIQSEVHLHVQNLTIGQTHPGTGGAGGGTVSGPVPIPTETWPAGKEFFIDTVNGNDANDGMTEGTAFQTWAKFKEVYCTKLTNYAEVQVKGTLNTPLDVEGMWGLFGNESQLILKPFDSLGEDFTIASPVAFDGNPQLLTGNSHLEFAFEYVNFQVNQKIYATKKNLSFKRCSFAPASIHNWQIAIFQDCFVTFPSRNEVSGVNASYSASFGGQGGFKFVGKGSFANFNGQPINYVDFTATDQPRIEAALGATFLGQPTTNLTQGLNVTAFAGAEIV